MILGEVLWEQSLLMEKFDRIDIACLGMEVLGCRILWFSAGMTRFSLYGPRAMALVLDSGTPVLKCGCRRFIVYGSITL